MTSILLLHYFGLLEITAGYDENDCQQPWLADTPIELETSTCILPHRKLIRTEFYKLFIQPFDWPRVSVCVKFHVFDTFFFFNAVCKIISVC